MQYAFADACLDELFPLIREYFATLSDVTDGFFDDHISNSDLHLICTEKKTCGFVAEKDGLMAAFYLRDAYGRDAGRVFESAIEAFGITRAFACSCDRAMVNLCIERAVKCGKKIEMQAYNFRLGNTVVREAEYDRTHVVCIPEEDYAKLHELSEGEWENELKEHPDAQPYAIEENGEWIGFGLLCPHKLRPHIVDIGNYVRPEHRQKGVGRSVIMNLTSMVLQAGLMPTVGCWYYNAKSYLTLTSAGYLPVTRIFCVEV